MRTRIYLTVGLLAALGCSDDVLNRATEPVNALFQRYVSVGNSITAGFQSGGINDSVQLQAYPVLLATQMNTDFFIPRLNRPGCPFPIDSVFVVDQTPSSPTFGKPHRIANTFDDELCALRAQEALPYVNNVAVPGAAVLDPTNNLDPQSRANQLTQLMLGGLTQVEMLQRVNPTFVTVWIGNNDVLAAATSLPEAGDSTIITDSATFATRYAALLTAIASTPASGRGVLIGVANVTAIPYFSQGQVYFALKAANQLPPSLTVGAACAPRGLGGQGDSVLVPFPFGIPKVARAFAGSPETLLCTEQETVQPRELALMAAASNAYNAYISSQATARGYAYVDPNALFAALAGDTSQVAPFPALTGPASVTRPFGLAFSRDGVHPSASTHKLAANAMMQAINATYGTGLAPIP